MLFDTTQLALERAIGGAAQRHAALASNLANVNTPDYQRVDVDFHTALNQHEQAATCAIRASTCSICVETSTTETLAPLLRALVALRLLPLRRRPNLMSS